MQYDRYMFHVLVRTTTMIPFLVYLPLEYGLTPRVGRAVFH